MIVGYIRTSTDRQDIDKQKMMLLEYAQRNKIIIDEFVEIAISSRKSRRERLIDQIVEKLSAGDTLVLTELSRLGRNMVETLNIIEELTKKGVSVLFVNQPELSTGGKFGKLLVAIYGYLAESEREFISRRVKEALRVVRARGIQLGRKSGTTNQITKLLVTYKPRIAEYIDMGLSLKSVSKLINQHLQQEHNEEVSYHSFLFFMRNHYEDRDRN